MNTTIKSICCEYSDDILYSQEENAQGYPHKIIIYIQNHYLGELSYFLHKHNYSLFDIKKFGKLYILVHFDLKKNSDNKSIASQENTGEI
jgi:hypothetical protein